MKILRIQKSQYEQLQLKVEHTSKIMPKQQDQGSKTRLERMWAIDAAITLFSMGFLMLPVHPIPWRYSTAYKILENVSVDTLCLRDPCRCQVDACYQLRRSSGSVDPAKDVRTGCPDTPSDGFVSHSSKDQAYLLLCVKTLLYNVRSFVPLFNGGKTFWLVLMSSRWWQGHHHPAGGC